MMWCSSQNTYPKLVNDSLIVISARQLKSTNLIFLEHKKLKQELPELQLQITTYASLVKDYEKTGSIRNLQVNRLMLNAKVSEQTIQRQSIQLTKLESKNTKLRKLTICGFSVSLGLLAILLIK